MSTRFFALALMLIGLSPIAAHAALEITITGGDTGAVPIAVVPFNSLPGYELDVAEVVESDLERSGLFKALPREDMLESPNRPEDINWRNWRALGIEQVVIGSLRKDPLGGVSVRFQLMDVYRATQVLGYDIPVLDARNLRSVAHQVADYIYEKLTGIPGVFNTQIAYVAGRGPANDRSYEMIVADADGANPRTVARSREPLMSPAWAPDGKRLAYVAYENGRTAVYIHELSTGVARKLVSEKGINGAPAWSPQGDRIVVTMSFEKNPDIYVIDVASGRRLQLTDHWGIDTEASWSPDGRRIAFTSDRGGQPQIYVVDADGGDARRVTFSGRQNLNASFSPNGDKLVLVNLDDAGYRIGLLDLSTQDLRILSEGGLDESPSFAPNGAVVIYSKQSNAGAELATVTTDGRVRQRLRQPGDVREPAWSPYARR